MRADRSRAAAMVQRRATSANEDSMKALIASVFAVGLLGASVSSAQALTIHVGHHYGYHHGHHYHYGWRHHRHCGAWGWHHHARFCRYWRW
jgi:hypothetical protein